MKVGSLVECIKASNYMTDDVHPVVGKIYTVREISTDAGTGLKFEEIVNEVKFQSYGVFDEISFDINRFRELLPPTEIDIEALLEEELVLLQ